MLDVDVDVEIYFPRALYSPNMGSASMFTPIVLPSPFSIVRKQARSSHLLEGSINYLVILMPSEALLSIRLPSHEDSLAQPGAL